MEEPNFELNLWLEFDPISTRKFQAYPLGKLPRYDCRQRLTLWAYETFPKIERTSYVIQLFRLSYKIDEMLDAFKIRE